MKHFLRFAALVVFAGLARLAAGSLEVPLEKLDYKTPEVTKLVAKLEAGADPSQVLKELGKLAKKNPGNIEAWMLQGLLQADAGDYAAAVASMEKGVKGQATDVPFLLLMARIHEDRAELGEGGIRRGGMVQYKAAALLKDEKSKAAFRSQELRAAAENFRAASAIRPSVKSYQIKRADLLLKAGDVREAREAVENSLKQNPNEAGLWLLSAKAAVALETWPEAQASAERCLALAPAEAEAYRVLSQCAGHAGKTAEAVIWERQGRFFAFIPPFLAVPYTAENYERLAPLLMEVGENETDAEREEKSKQDKAAISALLADKSSDATQLLGVIAWRHGWHGAVEDSIYAELAARNAEAVLMALFEHAQSYCTVGGCAPALARLNSDVAFPLIVERLPTDRTMYPMNLPEALAIYGRPEAVDALGQTVQGAIKEYRQIRNPGDFMSGAYGLKSLAERCVWSLSRFKTPAARTLLEKSAQDRELKINATGALFVQSGDRAFLDSLIRQLKEQPDEAEYIAARFRAANLPEAAQIDALVPARKKT
jgi:tetratricopeptide (TPR) repeat protein